MSLKNKWAATALAAIMFTPIVALSEPHAAQGVVYSTDPVAAPEKRPDPEKRFGERVSAYLEADKQAPPPQCGIEFIGSASIAIWKTLEADMAPAPVFGRGLGASTVADQIFFFEKIVVPYHPRALFFYAAENDVVNGLSPQEVINDFKRFMELKTKDLAGTPVYFIAAKASPARLSSAGGQQQVNEWVAVMAKGRKDLHYIDVAHDMWEGGKLLGTLKPIYRSDGIHLNADGYAIWTRIIKPYVDKESARVNACARP